MRGGQGLVCRLCDRQARLLIADDVVAEVDAFVADEDRGAGNEFLDLMLALAAEGTVEKLLSRPLFFCH